MSPPPAPADLPVLEMLGVAVASVHSPDHSLIRNIEWAVRPEDYWVVSGRPASGKSDLLTTAAGLMRPQEGVLRLFGQEAAYLREEERLRTQLRIGFVFPNGGRLFNHLTIRENLALPICYHRNCEPDAIGPRVNAVLEVTGLSSMANETPVALHRSLRQRVALARSLMLSPEFLLLDHPLAGLDAREGRWWLDFLDALLQGHPVLEGRPLTLVIGTDDLEPYTRARQVAFIHDRQFFPVGSRMELARQKDAPWRDLVPPSWWKE